MSRKKRPTLSLRAVVKDPCTEPSVLAVAVPNTPIQEKTMEQQQEVTAEAETPTPEEQLSAKDLAELEAVAAHRARLQAEYMEQVALRAKDEPITIIGLAAKGREALMEGLRAHAAKSKPPEYVPPPMTERQMSQTQREIEAGRATQAKHAAQQAHRPQPAPDTKEGFTTPVYRPGDVVPDPTIPATVGPGGMSAAGTRTYGPDAP